jgi:Tol biopolymer transport system component
MRTFAAVALGLLGVACAAHILQIRAVKLFAPGIASTEFSEARLTLSPDGTMAMWFSRNRPGGPGGYDIWMSRRRGAHWSNPEPVSFNSSGRDFDPAFSPDGRSVYFASDRPGGMGGDDLYRVAVTPQGFGSVEILANVNSVQNEWAPMLGPDRVTLLFASNGHGGAGRMDLFTARQQSGRFGAVHALPGAPNTPADEFDATFLADGSNIVFSRSADLRSADVKLYYTRPTRGEYGAGIELDELVNTKGSSTYAPMLDWSDPRRITFTTRRPADSPRAADLYLARLRVP